LVSCKKRVLLGDEGSLGRGITSLVAPENLEKGVKP
jgi:hypothetical protein